MCTLIAVHRRVPGRPLVVAANRDEYLDRPAEGPAIRETRVGRVLAPLDRRAGGTWLGLNEHGVFAALTNLRADAPDPQRRSRGEVVLDALGAASASEAARRLGELETEAYNPFNLFVADDRSAHVIVYRERAATQRLAAGVHVIGNVEATGPGNPKVKRIRDEVEEALSAELVGSAGRDDDEGLLDRLATVCRHHGSPGSETQKTRDRQDASNEDRHLENREPLGDTCVHIEGTYGTRSSLLLELGAGFSGGRLLHADGPPCRTAYEDVSSLLIELGRRPAVDTAESLMRTAS
ncbi:MAG: NRDE family protein [Actinomycetota bacterium]|nr:NRDE family protein [Actinomycetota bacterium]